MIRASIAGYSTERLGWLAGQQQTHHQTRPPSSRRVELADVHVDHVEEAPQRGDALGVVEALEDGQVPPGGLRAPVAADDVEALAGPAVVVEEPRVHVQRDGRVVGQGLEAEVLPLVGLRRGVGEVPRPDVQPAHLRRRKVTVVDLDAPGDLVLVEVSLGAVVHAVVGDAAHVGVPAERVVKLGEGQRTRRRDVRARRLEHKRLLPPVGADRPADVGVFEREVGPGHRRRDQEKAHRES